MKKFITAANEQVWNFIVAMARTKGIPVYNEGRHNKDCSHIGWDGKMIIGYYGVGMNTVVPLSEMIKFIEEYKVPEIYIGGAKADIIDGNNFVRLKGNALIGREALIELNKILKVF